MKRILAVDYGRIRIGLAMSDPTNTIARPLSIIKHENYTTDANKICEIVKDFEIRKIIVGITRKRDETLTQIAEEAMCLGKELTTLGFEVIYFDESMTTRDALDTARQMKVKLKKKKKDIDKIAASIILQDYLNSRE